MDNRDQSLIDELREPYEPRNKTKARLLIGLSMLALAAYLAACPDLPKNQTTESHEYSVEMD